MDCREASELISAAALGALEDSQRDTFEEHLAGCPSCRAALDHARRTLELVAGAHRESASDKPTVRVAAAGRAELAAIRRRRLGRLLAATAVAAACLLAAVWMLPAREKAAPSCGTCWRFVAGGPGNSRHAAPLACGIPDRVLWERPVSGMAGAYKPLAWKQLVLVGADPLRRTHRGGGRLLAIDGLTGKVRWKKTFPGGDFYKAKGFPDRCIAGGMLYLTDGEECLVLDAASGRELTRYAAPEDAAGWNYLTASEGRLFGVSRDGRTAFCLEAATGKVLWCRETGGRVFIPALADGRLYLATGAGDLVALSAASGAELWRRKGTAPAGRSSVHAAAGRVLVLAESGEVLAADGAGGEVLWRRRVKGAFASGVAVSERAAYFLGGTVALKLSDGQAIWRHADSDEGICSAPTLAGDKLLAAAGGKSGSLNVRSPSGELLGSLGEAAQGACDGAIVAGGRIYTVGGGRLRAVACRREG